MMANGIQWPNMTTRKPNMNMQTQSITSRGPGTVDQYPHINSTNTIGRPYREQGGGWFRVDTFQVAGNPPVQERYFAVGPDDYSPTASTMYAGHGNCRYHPRCSCCWLGFGHTLDYHNRHAIGDWNV